MEFCPKCGKLLKPVEEKGKTFLVCSVCNFKKESEGYTKKEEYEVKEREVEVAEGELNLPKTKEECQKCGNKEAYYWVEQIRAADEAPTRFYKCTKCGTTWREYA